MKEIRNAIKKYGDSQLSGNPTDWFKGLDQAEAEIKKIVLKAVLGWVGKDKPIKQNNDDFDNGFESGYNYAKDCIRKKIEGEL